MKKKQKIFDKFCSEKRTILYPQKFSEADVQFELGFALKNAGIDCRFEVVDYFQCEDGKLINRFDIVCYNNKKAFAIIEVKKNRQIPIDKNRRQYRKYSNYDCELIYCISMSHINNVIDKILCKRASLLAAISSMCVPEQQSEFPAYEEISKEEEQDARTFCLSVMDHTNS